MVTTGQDPASNGLPWAAAQPWSATMHNRQRIRDFMAESLFHLKRGRGRGSLQG
jgi:hypothetical protein